MKGQNGRLFSYKYPWRSLESPLGGTLSRRVLGSGVQGCFSSSYLNCFGWIGVHLYNNLDWFRRIEVKVVELLDTRQFFHSLQQKKLVQSNTGTTVVLSSLETSWETLQTADLSTTLAISVRLPIHVLLYRCFIRPKHQSGANFMWPTTINEIGAFVCRPVIQRQQR